jgi:magnesium transporter
LTKVGPQDDIEDVTLLFRKYKFLALPVVDKNNVLQGIITMQDIMQSRFEE